MTGLVAFCIKEKFFRDLIDNDIEMENIFFPSLSMDTIHRNSSSWLCLRFRKTENILQFVSSDHSPVPVLYDLSPNE